MTCKNKTYVEHTAIKVKDIKWYLSFFEEVFGMSVRLVQGTEENLEQVWLYGGVQLISVAGFSGDEGRLGHLGIMASNLEEVLEAAYSRGAIQLPQGRNWFRLPDGLCI
ncbi:MAG: VOC family protein, partial [Clostridia bacterium]